MKYFFSLVLFSFLFVNVNAQNHRNCGTTQYMNYLFKKDTTLKAKMLIQEDAIQDWIQKNGNSSQKAIITIPVVVHVLYSASYQNISDAQVYSQIAVLNADFRRLNADTSQTPSLFKSVAADVEVEFCVAHQTPTGAWTNGITRTLTTKTSFDINQDDAKFTYKGGHDAWDRNKYLNLWVVPEIKDGPSGGILGYAQFPGGPAATDGVVIGYRYFGNTGSVSYPYNKGRTATHEVGHWLSLYHIWGDDNGSCSGSDHVQDTPNQADYNDGCPSFPHPSCSNTSDMFMNYMDYTDDRCMNIYTAGQKQRMLATLNGSRASIKTSNKCQVVSIETPSIENQLRVYPNPSNGYIELDFGGMNLLGRTEISLYNTLGQIVYTKEYQDISAKVTLNFSELSHGVYFLRIKTDDFNINKKIEIL